MLSIYRGIEVKAIEYRFE